MFLFTVISNRFFIFDRNVRCDDRSRVYWFINDLYKIRIFNSDIKLDRKNTYLTLLSFFFVLTFFLSTFRVKSHPRSGRWSSKVCNLIFSGRIVTRHLLPATSPSRRIISQNPAENVWSNNGNTRLVVGKILIVFDALG